MTVQVGDRFHVTAAQEVRNNKGRLLARFLPQFDYRVTERNIGVVTQMITDNKAAAGGLATATAANVLASEPAKLKGKVSVGGKKQEK